MSSTTVDVGGGVSIAVGDHGDPAGDPLLLVHGFTGSSTDFAGVVPGLVEGRRVLTVDHRGHGDSTNTGDAASYTFDQLATDLAAVVEALGLDRFDLLGHSMGGIVSMRYLLASPAHEARVRSLVLMDTGAGADDMGGVAGWFAAGIDQVRANGLLALLEVVAPMVPEADRAHLRGNWSRMDGVAFCELGVELTTHPSMLDRLARIAIPTTVLVGELDAGLRGASDALAATIPGASLVVIDGAGHSPQIDRPDEWTAAVLAHLAGRP